MPSAPETATSARRRPSLRRPVALAHLVAGVVVVAGVLAQVVRPLAPDLGGFPDPQHWFDAAHLARVHSYRGPLYAAALAALVLRLAVPALAAFTPTGRRLVGRIVDRVGEGRPARAAAAAVVAVLAVSDLVVLPLAFWAGYVHEHAWGFRTQGVAGWSYDWVVATVPTWVVAAVLTAGGYTLARRLPRAWPAVAGLGGAALAAGLVFAAPLVLEPLRFDTQPLPPGRLHDEVQRVVTASGEDIDEFLVADASRRTTKRNAYVSGLGATRRVVLWDTLVDGHPPEDVGLVVAHELGHHRNADLTRATLTAGAGMVVGAYLLAALVRRRTAAGRQRAPADPRAAAVVLAAVVALNTVTLPVQNAMSRRAEAAADWAALDITGDPGRYREKHLALAAANLSAPDPPRWAYLLWSTHPPVAARLALADRWEADND